MPDREKIINEMEELSGFLFKEYRKAQAEEASLCYDRFLTVDNAIILLKEQETIPVQCSAIGRLKYGACPKCGSRIDDLVNPKACGFCGQAVKWNDK